MEDKYHKKGVTKALFGKIMENEDPQIYKQAKGIAIWENAMKEEFNALMRN